MRVIAGAARSVRLKAPRGSGTRPTTDRVKETLFNIIAGEVAGSLVLDLFAGSGALGIEALSRGADFAYFIENSGEACKCISDNLRAVKLGDKAGLIKQDVLTGLKYLGGLVEIADKTFDLIFIDPPYQFGYENKLFDILSGQRYVGEDTLIILEAEAKNDAADLSNTGFYIEKEKIYKTNKHMFIRKH